MWVGFSDPTLTVLLYSSIAAGASALGVLPLVRRERIPAVATGWANALAAGLMLGAAYLLMAAGTGHSPWLGALGATLGIGFVWLSHRAVGTHHPELHPPNEFDDVHGYQLLRINSLHSAPEGVAIGVAMVVSVPFGIFVALAMAVHNVPEATLLSAALIKRGVRLHEAAMLAVLTNLTQILLAVATFALVSAESVALPWALAFAVGALIYLVVAELLPECYRAGGHTTFALVTLVAMGIIVLLGGVAQ